MNLKDVNTAILGGSFDADLPKIERALRGRREALKAVDVATIKASIEEGDEVRIKEKAPLSPKYLLGAMIKVDKVNKTTISGEIVDSDRLRSRRFAGGIRVPLEHVEMV